MKALDRAIDYLIEHRWARLAWYFGISVITMFLVLIGDARAAYASYTGCVVQKDTQAVTRPGGDVHEPRWSMLEKGEAVAIRDTYKDWVFVLHHASDKEGSDSDSIPSSEWGWIPHNVLGSCDTFDGTP
jgi:hypothetical protein